METKYGTNILCFVECMVLHTTYYYYLLLFSHGFLAVYTNKIYDWSENSEDEENINTSINNEIEESKFLGAYVTDKSELLEENESYYRTMDVKIQ